MNVPLEPSTPGATPTWPPVCPSCRGARPTTTNVCPHCNDTSQSETISQATGGVLDSFLLDTDVLGGAEYQQNRILIPGSYTVQQLEFSQGTLNGDMEIHELAVQIEPVGMTEE